MADEVRGALARKILEREQSEGVTIPDPDRAHAETTSEELGGKGASGLFAAAIWAVSVAAGVVTQSVPIGLAVMAGSFMVLQIVLLPGYLKKRRRRAFEGTAQAPDER